MPHNIVSVLAKQQKMSADRNMPKNNDIWRHYKGDLYFVKGLVIRESNEEFDVIYSSISHPSIEWSRPLSEWLEIVECNDDGEETKRFSLFNRQ